MYATVRHVKNHRAALSGCISLNCCSDIFSLSLSHDLFLSVKKKKGHAREKKKKKNCAKTTKFPLLGDFTLSFTPFGACTFRSCHKAPKSFAATKNVQCLKGAFHRSLTVLVCYRFPLQWFITNI
jgi:hypothetical protein